MSLVTFITHDGYRLPTARVRCYRFAEELSRRGHKTHVISTVDHLEAKFDGDKRSNLWDTDRIMLNFKLLKEIRKLSPTILYMQKLDYHSLATILASKIDNVPLIFDYDDYEIFLNPFGFMKFIPMINTYRLTYMFIKEAKARIVSSHYLKEFFDSIRPGTFLIHTGVDTSRFKPGIGEDQKNNSKTVLSWAGVLWGEHVLNGFEMILNSFSKSKFRSSAVLRIHGSGLFWGDLVKLVNNYRSKCEIELIGWVHPDMMPIELDNIDIGLLPLQESTINKAKSPTKLFEYMALAKPTISSRIGEACHVIDDGRDGFLASTEDEWIEAMDRLISEPDLRIKMGENALIKINQHYSLQILGEQLDKIITKMEQT